MKSTFLKTLIVLAGLGLSSQALQAQTVGKRNVYLDVHPLLIPGGSVGADLQTDVNDYWTAGVTLGHAEASIDDEGYNGSSIGLVGTYFFNTPLLDSGYVKTHVDRSWTKVAVRDEESKQLDRAFVNSGNVSVLTGYHWTWNNGVNLNVGVGGAYRVVDSNAKKGIVVQKGVFNRVVKANLPDKTFRGLTPTAEFSVGVTI